MLRFGGKSIAVLTLVLMGTLVAAAPRKVIIDTDPGTDDAMAIMLALNSPEFDVRALTVVPGNVTAAQGRENACQAHLGRYQQAVSYFLGILTRYVQPI